MSWFSGLFAKDKKGRDREFLQLGVFHCDMHSHFLPGVDDGAQSLDDSLQLLQKMQALGYKKCITTPHIKMDIYPNSEEKLRQVFDHLQEEKERSGISIEVELAAEYFLDDTFLERLQQRELLCFGQERHVLMEFSFTTPPVFEEEAFKRVLDKGYVPVLAHFERYVYFHGRPEIADHYRKIGINVQMNLLSLTGHYGPEIRKQAERMVDDCLFDFVGTDAHRIQHLHLLEDHLSLPYLAELGKRLVKNQGL